MPIDPTHVTNCRIASQRYIDSLSAAEDRADWLRELRDSRKIVSDAIRASEYMSNVAGALISNGSHCLAFRQMMTPPTSQDQLKLLCPPWSKSSENRGLPLRETTANEVAAIIQSRLDPSITVWASNGRTPSRKEIESVLLRIPPLLAYQRISTARRNRMAALQELQISELLVCDGWTKLPSSLIDTRAAVPLRHFMHKTRFATAGARPQEVDIACGLRGTYVLAMECKVTNDETNSVKRINDILKKAKAWKDHWGSFVTSAALLQGVISPKDVQRLTDEGVIVFWSHDLPAFQTWLNTRS